VDNISCIRIACKDGARAGYKNAGRLRAGSRNTAEFAPQRGQTPPDEATPDRFSHGVLLVTHDQTKAIACDTVRCLCCWREMLDAHVCASCACPECGKTECDCAREENTQ